MTTHNPQNAPPHDAKSSFSAHAVVERSPAA